MPSAEPSTAGAVPGPYATERQAAAEPMPREIEVLHERGRVRCGDPDRLVSGTVRRHLEAACADSRVILGGFDRSTLSWLAHWEPATSQVVIGLIRRAYAAGLAAQDDPS